MSSTLLRRFYWPALKQYGLSIMAGWLRWGGIFAFITLASAALLIWIIDLTNFVIRRSFPDRLEFFVPHWPQLFLVSYSVGGTLLLLMGFGLALLVFNRRSRHTEFK